MRVFLLLALVFIAAPRVAAQAPGPVLLQACNDAPFGIGVAAAFRDTPADRYMIRGWFQIPAGECLEGGLGDVVGEDVWIGAVSGEWRWPATDEPEQAFCTPAQSFFEQARLGDCSDNERLTGFERVALEPFQAGWDRARVRFSCEDFEGEEAALCQQTQEGPDGLAVPVRSLEVCNAWPVAAEIAIGAGVEFGGFESTGWETIPPRLCQIVYRGFPMNGEVWFVSRRAGQDTEAFTREARLCVSRGAFTAQDSRQALVNAEQCPAEAPVAAAAQRVRFNRGVSRYQAYVPRD
ncbi:DUF1036 domain-containing protein [Hyphobacterium sp.]|uniref:DUF1036 domain-containing protein n=1 Tax=Hyphobacterium sp. TaxID=2004662 RepID=UPI003BAC1952